MTSTAFGAAASVLFGTPRPQIWPVAGTWTGCADQRLQSTAMASDHDTIFDVQALPGSLPMIKSPGLRP